MKPKHLHFLDRVHNNFINLKIRLYNVIKYNWILKKNIPIYFFRNIIYSLNIIMIYVWNANGFKPQLNLFKMLLF